MPGKFILRCEPDDRQLTQSLAQCRWCRKEWLSHNNPPICGLGEVPVLAILQNQWFKNPESARAAYARNPERRHDLNRAFLFLRSTTGRNLRREFGQHLCDHIIWEEASPKIGGKSDSKFPPDPDHIAKQFELVRPRVVLLFGAIAAEGWDLCLRRTPVMRREHGVLIFDGPHPAARTPEHLLRFKWMAAAVRDTLLRLTPGPVTGVVSPSLKELDAATKTIRIPTDDSTVEKVGPVYVTHLPPNTKRPDPSPEANDAPNPPIQPTCPRCGREVTRNSSLNDCAGCGAELQRTGAC
jgi:hypothetical protein